MTRTTFSTVDFLALAAEHANGQRRGMLTIDHFLTDEHDFLTRPEILHAGGDDRTIAAMLASGALTRIGVGLYANAARYRKLTAEDQHRVRCHAVATRFDQSVAFTHQSAALLHDIALWGFATDNVHVTRRDDGRGRIQAGVDHHVGAIPDDEVTEVNGLPLSKPHRTLWELATTGTVETALVAVDSALHKGLTDEAGLIQMAARYGTWRGARRAKVTFSFSNGKSESPGESRCRYAFARANVDRPELQFEVFDGHRLIGRTDFAWPAFRHLAEFDGMLKYRLNGLSGEALSHALAQEKAREDLLRAQGWGMTRIVWSDLSPGRIHHLIARLRTDMAQSRRQFA